MLHQNISQTYGEKQFYNPIPTISKKRDTTKSCRGKTLEHIQELKEKYIFSNEEEKANIQKELLRLQKIWFTKHGNLKQIHAREKGKKERNKKIAQAIDELNKEINSVNTYNSLGIDLSSYKIPETMSIKKETNGYKITEQGNGNEFYAVAQTAEDLSFLLKEYKTQPQEINQSNVNQRKLESKISGKLKFNLVEKSLENLIGSNSEIIEEKGETLLKECESIYGSEKVHYREDRHGNTIRLYRSSNYLLVAGTLLKEGGEISLHNISSLYKKVTSKKYKSSNKKKLAEKLEIIDNVLDKKKEIDALYNSKYDYKLPKKNALYKLFSIENAKVSFYSKLKSFFHEEKLWEMQFQ